MAQKKVRRIEELTGDVGDAELKGKPLPLQEGSSVPAEPVEFIKKTKVPKAKLADFLKSLDEHANEQCHVTVIRCGPHMVKGRAVKLDGVLATAPIDEFDTENPAEAIDNMRRSIAEEHGRGSYSCSLYDGNGKLAKRWGFEVLTGVIPECDYEDGAQQPTAPQQTPAVKGAIDTTTLLGMAEAEQARLIEKKKLRQLERNNEKLRQEVEPDDEPEEEEEETAGHIDPSMIVSPEEIQKEAFAAGKAAAAEEFEEKAEKTMMLDMMRELKAEIKELKTNPPKSGDTMFDKIVALMIAAQENNTKLFTSMLTSRADQPQQPQLPLVIEKLVEAAINKTIPSEHAEGSVMDRAIETVSSIVGLRNQMGAPFGSAEAVPQPWWQTLLTELSGPIGEFIALKKLEAQQKQPGITPEEIERIVQAQVQERLPEIRAQAARALQAQGQQPFAKAPHPVAPPRPAELPMQPQEQKPNHFRPIDQTLPVNGPLPGVVTQELPPLPPQPDVPADVKAGIAKVLTRLQQELQTCPERITWIGECYTNLPPDMVKRLEADPTDQGLVKVLTSIANPLQLFAIANELKSDPKKGEWFDAGLNAWRESLQQPLAGAQGGITESDDDEEEEEEEVADGAGQQAPE